MNLFKELWDNFTESKPLVAPTVPIMYNDLYPYTFEQTIRVTHHSKPKRRDPARKWNKTKNYRY
jgi:hypothetical protein